MICVNGKGKLLEGVPMELSLDTSAGTWLMGFRLRLGWTDMPARKLDWLMGLGSKSKCHVSAGKLSSGTSGNSVSILSTSCRISLQKSISFYCTDCWYGSFSFSFKSESLPTDIWKKKTIHVGCMDKRSQNIHLLLIWDFERHKLSRIWSKPRKFMPLKYVKKTEGLKQNKIGHYVLGKATIDTVIKIDKDCVWAL